MGGNNYLDGSAWARASWGSLGAASAASGTPSDTSAEVYYREAARIQPANYSLMGTPGKAVINVRLKGSYVWGGFQNINAYTWFNEGLVYDLYYTHVQQNLYQLAPDGHFDLSTFREIPITLGEWFNFSMKLATIAGAYVAEGYTTGGNLIDAMNSFTIDSIRVLDAQGHEIQDFIIVTQSGHNYNNDAFFYKTFIPCLSN
jgi:hypothetical protein